MNSFDKRKDAARRSRGVTLLETMVAMFILLFGIVSVASLFGVAVGKNKGHGEVATRTTEYCQDKMEQLMNLGFSDGATDTTVFPSNPLGGTGLGGTMAANATVGSVDPTNPVAGYVDYLDETGNLLAGNAANAFYTRQWSITTDATGTLKTISVITVALSGAGDRGTAPSTQLVSRKTQF